MNSVGKSNEKIFSLSGPRRGVSPLKNKPKIKLKTPRKPVSRTKPPSTPIGTTPKKPQTRRLAPASQDMLSQIDKENTPPRNCYF